MELLKLKVKAPNRNAANMATESIRRAEWLPPTLSVLWQLQQEEQA